MSTDTDLSKYTSGLISNWIKKDPRLNGNKKHQSSSSNSSSNRVGNSDSQVKELKKLLKATTGTDSEQEVAEALNARINELKINKTSRAKSSISVESIPENLQHLVK